MAVFLKKFELQTTKQFEIVDITKQVNEAIKRSKMTNGLVNVYTPHTTASVKLNHFEPLLLQDIMKLMYRLAPLESNYAHDFFEVRTQVEAHERSNGHAHLKAFILGSSESVPLEKGELTLGYRQSVFFVELDGARKRSFIVNIVGE